MAQPRKWGRHTKEQRAALLDLADRWDWMPSTVPDDVMADFCTEHKVNKVRCPTQALALVIRCRRSAASARVLAAATHVGCAHRTAYPFGCTTTTRKQPAAACALQTVPDHPPEMATRITELDAVTWNPSSKRADLLCIAHGTEPLPWNSLEVACVEMLCLLVCAAKLLASLNPRTSKGL